MEYEVWRQDDNGNKFLVQTFATKKMAEMLVRQLEAHKHKQMYYIEPKEGRRV